MEVELRMRRGEKRKGKGERRKRKGRREEEGFLFPSQVGFFYMLRCMVLFSVHIVHISIFNFKKNQEAEKGKGKNEENGRNTFPSFDFLPHISKALKGTLYAPE